MNYLNSLRLSALAGLLAVAFVSLPAVAEAGELPFSLQTTPGQLPKNVIPVAYALTIDTDLERNSFSGSENITVDILSPTRTLVLNQLNLNVRNVVLNENELPISTMTDSSAQTETIVFRKPLSLGTDILSISFSGSLQTTDAGLFALSYSDGTQKKKLIGTMFEASDARRMFPCWDEPAFRAKFTLTATVPSNFVAISNMPVAREAASRSGYKTVTFEQTPSMPTYLLDLAAGEFSSLTGGADGIPIHIDVTNNQLAKARFALSLEERLLPYYDRYYGVKYPLPKLDLIAFPGGFDGGMENWGAIIFSDDTLLFDPSTQSDVAKEQVMNIIAHETAHQWTGDLVTSAWWSDIWLNEGFADWMDETAEEKLYPQWHPWTSAANDKTKTMNEDSLVSSHPIYETLNTPNQFNAAFDNIEYVKGQSVLRMFEEYLGEAVFERAMKIYIRDRQFSNATSIDFWDALTKASGQPMNKIGLAWIDSPGFPEVSVQITGSGVSRRLLLSQRRYLTYSSIQSKEIWEIPIELYDPTTRARATFLMTGRTATYPFPGSGPIIVNPGSDGYYRVRYSDQLWGPLAANAFRLQPADLITLLSDRWALVKSGEVSPQSYLEFVDQLSSQTSYQVWNQILESLDYIDHLENGRPGSENFRAFARNVVTTALRTMPPIDEADPNERMNRLRVRLFESAAKFGDIQSVQLARTEFFDFLNSQQSLPSDLRRSIIDIVGTNADQETYDELHKLALSTSDFEMKRNYYRAMGLATDPALAQETLALSLRDEMPNPYGVNLLVSIAGAGEHPDLAWDFYKKHMQEIDSKLDSDTSTTFATSIAGNFHDEEHAEDFLSFARDHMSKDLAPQVKSTVEQIRLGANFTRIDLPAIDLWCSSHQPVAQAISSSRATSGTSSPSAVARSS